MLWFCDRCLFLLLRTSGLGQWQAGNHTPFSRRFPSGCVKEREGDGALPVPSADDTSIRNWQRRVTERRSRRAWALPSSQTSLFLSLPQATASAGGAQHNMEQPRAESDLVHCGPTVEGLQRDHLLHGMQ